MIHEICLRHFQSHKKTDLQFVPGVNSIIGSSNNGKTAILRALFWAVYNRPSGLSFVSHWNRDKNDKPIKNTLVRVITENGTIERRKGHLKGDEKDFNGYIINENILEAIGQDVPDEVTKFFNIDSVNIQKQMDAPFLLSESAGEVARFFNSTIRLDLIDRILSKAESKKREVNKEKTRLESESKEIERELLSFDWIEEAEGLSDRIVKIETRFNEKEKYKDNLSESVSEYVSYEENISKQNVFLSAVPLIEKIDSMQELLDKKMLKFERLQNLHTQWLEQNNYIKGTADFISIQKMIDKIDDFRKEIYDKVQLKDKIEESIDEYENNNTQIGMYEIQIKENKDLLPNICPLCGGKL